MSAPKRSAQSKTTAKTNKRFPVLAIGLGVAAALLVVAVMLAGGEQLGGSEFGEPTIAGEALPTVLDFVPVDASQDPAFGTTIPSVSGQDFDGSTVEIAAGDAPIAILFVSHSCPHCQDEIPEIQTWLNAGGGVPGVEIVTVSTAANSAAANWPPSAWLESEGWQPPVIADDADSSVFRAFGGRVIPYWVFVDGNGIVTRRNPGRMEIPALQAAMAETIR